MAGKFIESEESKQYKKQLAEFLATINPKPSLEDIERIKQELLKKRGQ